MYILRPDARPHGTHYYLLQSDVHIGSPQTDYKLIEEELKQAKELNAKVRVNGDLFDLILPSDHKKYRPEAVHKRLRGRSDIVNEAVEWAAELYAGCDVDMAGTGNHDDWMLEKHSFDVIRLFCEKIGKPRAYSGYTCFIQDKFTDDQRHTNLFTTFAHHGAGGGGSMSSAIGEFDKKLKFIDADLIWMGHRHFRLFSHMRRLSCPRGGFTPRYKEVYYVMTGGYMDCWRGERRRSRRSSYAEDKGLPPQGKGGVLLKVVSSPTGIKVTTEIS